MVTVEAPPRCRTCGFEKGDCNCILLLPGAQENFVRSEAKHPGLFGGRGSSKTVSNIVKGFKYVSDHPGARGVLTSPTFPMLRQTLLPAIREFFGSEEGRKWEYKRGDMEIQFRDGSVIYLRPAEEPGTFRGMTLAFFGMDEIAEGFQHETFLTLQPALRQKGFPHQGWAASTPHWRKPWLRKVWKEHINAVTGEPLTKEDYPIFQADTAKNWHLPENYLEHLQESYGDTLLADQELHGKFIIVEGAGFQEFNEDVHVRYAPPEGTTWKRKVAGLDFGGGASPTALVEWGVDQGGRFWALREYYSRDTDNTGWTKAAVDWGVTAIFCDPAGGFRRASELSATYGLPIFLARNPGGGSANSFKYRQSLFGTRLRVRPEDNLPGLFITRNCPNLIAEIPNLALHKPRGQDYYVDEWIPGSLDHAYDASCYAIMELEGTIADWKPPTVVEHGVLA